MLSLLEILKTEYSNEYSIEMLNVTYKSPKIYHGGDDYDFSKMVCLLFICRSGNR